MFASPVAIGAVFSMGAIAQYIAFVFPIALKVFSAKGRFRPGTFLHFPYFSLAISSVRQVRAVN